LFSALLALCLTPAASSPDKLALERVVSPSPILHKLSSRTRISLPMQDEDAIDDEDLDHDDFGRKKLAATCPCRPFVEPLGHLDLNCFVSSAHALLPALSLYQLQVLRF